MAVAGEVGTPENMSVNAEDPVLFRAALP